MFDREAAVAFAETVVDSTSPRGTMMQCAEKFDAKRMTCVK